MKYYDLESYQHRPRLGNICICCGKSCRSHPTQQRYWEIYWRLSSGKWATVKAFMHKACDEEQPQSDEPEDGVIL